MLKFKKTGLILAGLMAITAIPAQAATQDIVQTATTGGKFSLLQLLGIAGIDTQQIASTKSVNSLSKLLGVEIPSINIPTFDEDISKAVAAGVDILGSKDKAKSAMSVIGLLNKSRQSSIEKTADKTAEDAIKPTTQAVSAAEKQIEASVNFADAVPSMEQESSLDAMRVANGLAAEKLKLEAAGASVANTALAQGKESNERLNLVGQQLKEQGDRQRATDQQSSINSAAFGEADRQFRENKNDLVFGVHKQNLGL